MKLPTLLILAVTPLALLQAALLSYPKPAPQATAQEPAEEVRPDDPKPTSPTGEAAPQKQAKPLTPLLDEPESEGASVLSEPPAELHHGHRPALKPGRTFAPIGIPLAQQVATGQVGVTLRATHEQFDGLRDSRKNLTSADAFTRGYSIAPTDLLDQRFELEAIFGLNQRLDLYMVLPYTAREMDQDLSLGGQTTIESSGLGDIQVGGVLRSHEKGPTRLSFMAGISLPTGQVDVTDSYAGASSTTLPYRMQLGTGTLDLLPGIMLESRLHGMRVGARASGRIHLEGAHDESWFHSNSMRLDLWASKQIAKDLRGSLRAEANWWGDLHGADPDMVPLRNPLEDALHQGGSRVTLFGGLSKDLSSEGNSRVELEIGLPVEEWLDGPALSQDWTAVIGWRLRF
ncbi:MAG: hypothetical protein GY930_14785 [bacterium]|nr:hypothetical protein [bacterium]